MTGKLPIWMDGSNAQAFKSLMGQWWEQVGLWARLPSTAFDVLTCAMEFVDLLAFQRGITRYSGEAEGFYRLRVHHALRNIRSAGTPRGMNEIFSNLGLPEAEYFERLPVFDWDVTKVRVPSRAYADATLREQIHFVLSDYWRTCRRFNVAQKTDAVTSYSPANTFSQRTKTIRIAVLPTLQARFARSTAQLVANSFSSRQRTIRTLTA